MYFICYSIVIAGILHAVQDGIQSQMATKIETLEAECSMTELPADDTALYRISGWALKSCIDKYQKTFEEKWNMHACTQVQQQFYLLLPMKRPNSTKVYLPTGAQYLDRGGLTFVHSCLLPWLNAVEESMKVFLNHDGYTRYGKDIFHVRFIARGYYGLV